MIKTFISLLSIVLLLFSLNVKAQWSTNPNINNAICTAVGDQQIPEMISDGNGGAIITWRDYRNGASDIYAQRISAGGIILWAIDGVSICSAPYDQYSPVIICDGSGGAIITWIDQRNKTGINVPEEMYSQHINASGTIQWSLDGISICTSTNVQSINMVSDSAGGAIITWADNRNGTDYNIFVQRVNSSGSVQWTNNGVLVCTTTNNEYPKSIVNDGSGGAIIIWNVAWNFYAQKINSSGAVQWNTNWILVGDIYTSPYKIKAIADGFGGVIFSSNYRNIPSPAAVFLQHIDNNGTILWNNNGVLLGGGAFVGVGLISDQHGGVIVAWENITLTADVQAQRISYSGVEQWTTNGILISNTGNFQGEGNIVSDGSKGAIIVWPDGRNSNLDLYAQKIDSSGIIQWANGVVICTGIDYPQMSKTISDGSGGAIVTWMTNRNTPPLVTYTNYDVYAQKIYSNGALVGINEIAADNNSVKVFPNPNNGKFIIESKKEGKYSIVNELGQTIQSFKLDGINNYTMSLETLTNGIYFITGENNNEITNQKIVVMK